MLRYVMPSPVSATSGARTAKLTSAFDFSILSYQHETDRQTDVSQHHGRRNLFGRHGNSRTTFEGGTAHNVKCRTTF